MNSVNSDIHAFMAHSSPIIGGGEMGELIRCFEWSHTSLGSIAEWPASLKTTVNIVLQSPVPLVLLWGQDGIMIYNDAYSVFAGGRHPFLLGAKVIEGWPEVADFNQNVMEKGLNGETLSYKDQRLTLFRNDVAENVWMDLNYSPIINEDNKPAGVLAIVTETTKRILTEHALKESEERFRALAETSEVANHRKSQFLATMSHELRTPLNAIIGYSEMLMNGLGGPLNEKQIKYVTSVTTSGRHLLDMVNEILDLAKIEAGSTNLRLEQVNLVQLMHEKQITFQLMAEKKNITILCDIAPNLSDISADPQRIKQILMNLLSNAIKFNHPNGSVFVRWSIENSDWVVCEVEDTGYGIPEAKLPELFNDFYQVDNSFSRQQEGTGLGLAVTKRLIELHGGNITVKSQEGSGSTFTFKLPVNK